MQQVNWASGIMKVELDAIRLVEQNETWTKMFNVKGGIFYKTNFKLRTF